MNYSNKINHVLIVDDEAVMRNGISKAFQSKGIDAALATNGREALNLLSHQPFDLFLLDIRMPDMYGWDRDPGTDTIQTPHDQRYHDHRLPDH